MSSEFAFTVFIVIIFCIAMLLLCFLIYLDFSSTTLKETKTKYKTENGLKYKIETLRDGSRVWWHITNDCCKSLELHRENGPSIIIDKPYNCKHYYKHGKLHRENGPAVEYNRKLLKFYYPALKNEYWLNGKHYEDISSDDEWLIVNIIE